MLSKIIIWQFDNNLDIVYDYGFFTYCMPIYYLTMSPVSIGFYILCKRCNCDNKEWNWN